MSRKKSPTEFFLSDLTDIVPSPGFHSDFGGWALQWTCPRCSELLTWSPVLRAPLTCACGTWNLSLEIACDGVPVLKDVPVADKVNVEEISSK